jgi:PAS domain S-box-containing protein
LDDILPLQYAPGVRRDGESVGADRAASGVAKGRLSDWLRAPVFEDEAKTHHAFMLHVVLWAMVFLPFPYVAGVALKSPELLNRALVQALVGETANAVLLVLLRMGHVRAASIAQVGALFAFMTVTAMTGAGLQSEAYQMGFPVVILIAGVLLGVGAAIAWAMAALAIGAAMLSRPPLLVPELNAHVIWVVSVGLFPVIATLQYLSERTVRRALTRATSSLAETQRAEAALRESEHRFRTLAEAPFEGIMIHEDGIIREASYRFAEIFGYGDPSELVGTDCIPLLLTPESAAKIQEGMDAGLLGPIEVVGVRKDGSTFYGETQSREIPYRGRSMRVVAMRDITERRRAEAERAMLQEQLVRAHRLESIGRLAAGVAHDFNNLLTCVVANATVARRRLPPEDPSIELLTEVLDAADRAAKLTRQLLAVGRQETAVPVLLDANEVIRGISSMLKSMVGERVELLMALDSPVPEVRIDPSQLERVLANLCVNARDALPEGGRVEVRTELVRLSEDEARTYIGATAGEHVRITVLDTGVGMQREVLDRLFEPFFTTKEPGRGTGLGLATVHGIVTQNRGFLRVESEKGKGTAVSVYLPRAVKPAEPPRLLGSGLATLMVGHH